MCDITVKTISARLADRFPGLVRLLGFLVLFDSGRPAPVYRFRGLFAAFVIFT